MKDDERFGRKAVFFQINNQQSCFFMAHLTPCIHPFSKHGEKTQHFANFAPPKRWHIVRVTQVLQKPARPSSFPFAPNIFLNAVSSIQIQSAEIDPSCRTAVGVFFGLILKLLGKFSLQFWNLIFLGPRVAVSPMYDCKET